MTLLKYSPFGDVDEMPGIRQMQETLSRFLKRAEFPAVDSGRGYPRDRKRTHPKDGCTRS